MKTYESHMVFDLKQSIKTLFSASCIESLVLASGEDVHSVRKGLEIANAASLYHILLHSRQPKKQLGIQRMARVAAGSSLQKELIHLYQGKSHLQGILNMTRIVYGEDYREVEKLILEHTQLNAATVRGLMQLSLPVMLSICGSKISSVRLTPEGFAVFIEQLQPVFNELIPAGVSLPLQQWDQAASSATTSIKGKNQRKSKKTSLSITGRLKWSLFILTGITIICLLLVL